MKTIYILSCLLVSTFVTSAQNEVFKKDFDTVTNIFEEELAPYLYKFAKNQMSPNMDSLTREDMIQYKIEFFKEKVKRVRDENFKKLSKIAEDKTQSVNKDYLLGYFHMCYTMEFPGVDYIYFDKCTKRVVELAKKNL